jgi:thiamine biosynthesis lipoprotein
MLTQYFETKQALGGDVTMVLVAEDDAPVAIWLAQLWRQVYTFERQFSRFLPSSELSELNRQAGVRVSVSPEFRELLIASKQLSEQTRGLYNPFILPALQRAGYTHSALPGYEQDSFEDHRRRSVVTADRLEITTKTVSIPYGTALDMGGCGKGYLADQLAATLAKLPLTGFWVSLSGDLVTSGTDAAGEPWRTTVQSFGAQDTADYEVRGNGQTLGIATSGTFQRANQTLPGKTAHHIIDPRTQQPAETDVCLATIVARSGVQADVLASCAVILGSKQAPAFLKQQGVKGYYLQTDNEALRFGKTIVKRTKTGVAHVA